VTNRSFTANGGQGEGESIETIRTAIYCLAANTIPKMAPGGDYPLLKEALAAIRDCLPIGSEERRVVARAVNPPAGDLYVSSTEEMKLVAEIGGVSLENKRNTWITTLRKEASTEIRFDKKYTRTGISGDAA
jgi:hypothetical protein